MLQTSIECVHTSRRPQKPFTKEKEKWGLLSKFLLKSMHRCKTMELLRIEIQLPIKLKTTHIKQLRFKVNKEKKI